MDIETLERFHNAVRWRQIEVVRTMLAENRALATSGDAYGYQAIHFIDLNFDEEVLNLLLANGADINAKNEFGLTLLHTVNDPDAVSLLVGQGADLEARDASGRTPLVTHAENYEDGSDVVFALLEMGADPSAKSNEGETALMFARQSTNHDLIQRLIGLGARD